MVSYSSSDANLRSGLGSLDPLGPAAPPNAAVGRNPKLKKKQNSIIGNILGPAFVKNGANSFRNPSISSIGEKYIYTSEEKLYEDKLYV